MGIQKVGICRKVSETLTIYEVMSAFILLVLFIRYTVAFSQSVIV